MSNSDQPEAGTIVWTDLTVENAGEIRDFYCQVVGWRPEPVDMGDYSITLKKLSSRKSGRSSCGIGCQPVNIQVTARAGYVTLAAARTAL